MELFRQGALEYRGGHFEASVELLRRAYAIEPAAVLQYNLARALEGLGDLEGALVAYEAFLEGEPETDDRGAIEARITTLRRQIAERAALEDAAGETESAPIAGAASTGRDPSPAPWIIAGVGALGLGVAVVLGVLAQSRNDEAMTEPVHERTVALVDEAQGLALAANVTWVAAGVVTLAGLVFGIVDVVSSADGDVALRAGPGAVALRARFP